MICTHRPALIYCWDVAKEVRVEHTPTLEHPSSQTLAGWRQRRKCFPVGCSVSRIDLWDHNILKTINHNTSQYPVNMSATISLLCLTQVGRLELPLHISQIRIKSWSSRCCRELAIRQSLSKGSLDKDRRKPQQDMIKHVHQKNLDVPLTSFDPVVSSVVSLPFWPFGGNLNWSFVSREWKQKILGSILGSEARLSDCEHKIQ